MNHNNYLPSLINIFAAIIAEIAADKVATHTGRIMLVGFVEFKEVLIAITVVGINWSDAVLISTNIAMELLRVVLDGFCFCNVSIACKPRGVEAFPRPKIFAIIFKEISSCALLFLFTSGNKNFISGFKALESFLDNEESFAICIIPHQSVIVPKNVSVNSTAVDADSKIPLLTFSRLPENSAYIYEIMINIGHSMFNM